LCYYVPIFVQNPFLVKSCLVLIVVMKVTAEIVSEEIGNLPRAKDQTKSDKKQTHCKACVLTSQLAPLDAKPSTSPADSSLTKAEPPEAS